MTETVESRSRRRKLSAALALAVSAVFLQLAAVPAAQAGKTTDSLLGPDGAGNGELSRTAGLALNHTGAGGVAAGTLYAVDLGNHRVSVFDSAGNFIRAWGWGVVASGPGNDPRNEIQEVTVSATGGTFTLRLKRLNTDFSEAEETTAPIAFDASASTLQSALEETDAYDPGDFSVTGPDGGPWSVEFTGALADTDLRELIADSSELTGGASTVTVATTQPGANFEVCEAADSDVCRAGQSGGAAGQLGSAVSGVTIDQADGTVYVSGDDRVQKFTATGEWLRTWGRDVVVSGGTGDTPPVNERLRVEVTTRPGEPVTGGTFHLRLNHASACPGPDCTEPIPHDATAAEVEAALMSLEGYGAGDVTVTGAQGGPWTVEFTGSKGGTNIPFMDASDDLTPPRLASM